MTANPAADVTYRAPDETPFAGPAESAPPAPVARPIAPDAPQTYVLQDVLRSLTGFDELAVEQNFGRPVMEFDSTWLGRVALFVLRRRAGATDAEAHREAMTATIGQIDDLFVDPDAIRAAPASLEEYLAADGRPPA